MTWEERWHPLREEWVIVAAHRQNRPWSGERVQSNSLPLPDYVEDCYLCPGNARISGERNAVYTTTLVFDNDHPCVGPDAPKWLDEPGGRSEEHTSELQSRPHLVCRLLLEKKKKKKQ